MKKSYHSIIDPAQDAKRTVRIERGEVAGEAVGAIAGEVMPEVAVQTIRPQLCQDGYRA